MCLYCKREKIRLRFFGPEMTLVLDKIIRVTRQKFFTGHGKTICQQSSSCLCNM